MSVPVDPDFEAQAFALVPMDRCPCGRTTTRDLTEKDAAALIHLIVDHAAVAGSQLGMLNSLGAFLEFRAREFLRDECRCSELLAPPLPTKGFHLYRLWAEGERLLYVGVSTRLAARIRVHRQRWGDLIARVTWEEHPDERAMLDAERIAITEEDPALNKAGVG